MELFLQHLRELSVEAGRVYIQKHAHRLADHAAFGVLLADEALNQFYTNPSVSLKLSELLIFFAEYVHHDSSHALGLKAKGDALMLIGHEQAAMDCLDAAGEQFRSLGDEVNWARTRISWIIACAWLGRAEEALQEAARAREVFQRLGQSYWVCVIDHNTAMIYEDLGRYQEASRLYENMLSIYPSLVDQDETSIKRAIAMAEMHLAVNLALLGNFQQAFRIQQKARASFITLEEIDLIITSEFNLAELDYTQGYYGSALRRYYHARDSLTQHDIDNPLMLAELKLWMASCLGKLNRAQEACQLAKGAVEIYQQRGTLLQATNALREYATTLIASGRLKEALSALGEAWTMSMQGGFEPYAFATRLQQAELLLDLGSFTEAYDQARLIREYFETQGLLSYSVRASLVMAGALIGCAQQPGKQEEHQSKILHEAASLCEQASRRARQHNLQEHTYKSQYLLGQLASIQGNLSKAAKYYQAAINHIEQILGDLVHDQYSSFLHSAWTVYEDMIALCLRQAQKDRAFAYLERVRSLALRQYLNKSQANERAALPENSAELLRTQYELRNWQERYHEYSALLTAIDPSVSPSIDREVIHNELQRCEAKISELFERLHLHQSANRLASHPKKPAAHSPQGINIAQLRQQLLPDQLLLAYFLYKGQLVTFAVTKERLITHEQPDGAAQLERLLPLLHVHLDPGGWPDPHKPPEQVVRRLLKRLYDLLVAPVEALLPPSSGYLTIVPYGPLHGLPFHALYNGSHFLVEDFQINYLPASNVLLHLSTDQIAQDVPCRDKEVSISSALIFGYSENGHLPRVAEEVKTVAALLDGKCYLEREATIDRLTEEAPGSPIIHLATHGQRRLDAPNFSYVRLADGQLNAIDAFSLNLRECELVALSGCETGLALTGGGDEQLGLGRAFLAAGAKSLLMSLWPVEDNATNELMQLFYRRLLDGDTRVQALRAAQCELLQRPSSTHPYFWAAFRLVGEAGMLHALKAKEAMLAFNCAQ